MKGEANDRHMMWEETQFTEPDAKSEKDVEFYPWQCVSFVRWNGTSLDLIVRNNVDMMTLINIV